MGRHKYMDIQRSYIQDTMIHIFSYSISSVSQNCCCISFTCHPAALTFPAQKCVCCRSKNINLGKKDLLKDMEFELYLSKQAKMFWLYFFVLMDIMLLWSIYAVFSRNTCLCLEVSMFLAHFVLIWKPTATSSLP